MPYEDGDVPVDDTYGVAVSDFDEDVSVTDADESATRDFDMP